MISVPMTRTATFTGRNWRTLAFEAIDGILPLTGLLFPECILHASFMLDRLGDGWCVRLQ